MTTIIIGVGNPVLTDDGVGLKVARELKRALSARKDIETCELCAGGLRLAEAMAGYDRAIVIDAIVSQGGPPGSILVLAPSDLRKTRNTCSSHDAGLAEALELARIAGLQMPKEITIWAIEAGDVETFSERLTEPVALAVPRVVEGVIRYLAGDGVLPPQRAAGEDVA